MIVGTMKDKKLKIRGLHPSDTLAVQVQKKTFVYYESRKGELKTRPIYECR
jgi:hypothetical protein